MDFPGINKLLIVTEDQFKAVRMTYKVTSESLNRDVDNLISWYNLQEHLPQAELDRQWLERILISNKCSVERAKSTIDSLFKSRNLEPDLFLNRNVRATLAACKRSLIGFPLPKLLPDNTRVTFFKLASSNPDYFDAVETFKGPLFFLDYRQIHDYSIGDRLIMDTSDFSSSFVIKTNPLMFKRAYFVCRQIYGFRVASIHFLHVGPMVQWLVTILRAFVPDKLISRMKVHSDLESLHREIPKNILPKEYGGEEMSSEELFEKWQTELCNQEEYFKNLENYRSDESKRTGEPANDYDIFGVAGTFKSLNLD